MARLPTRGCTFKLGSTAIAQVIEIGGINISCETLDITELADSVRKYMATVMDSGEASLTVHYDADVATHDSLYDLFAAQLGTSGTSIVITLTDTTPTTFTAANAILTNFEIAALTIGEAIKATFTFKISDAWVVA